MNVFRVIFYFKGREYYMALIFGLILTGLLGLTLFEIRKNLNTNKIPARPEAKDNEDGFDQIMNSNIHELLQKLEQGEKPTASDYKEIEAVCEYLDARYDCSDFRMQTLLRILYRHSALLEELIIERIKKSLLDSKYFMDQPGQDSLCLWSENHLLLFATAEYLTGQMFERDIFSNDGLKGKEHKAIARERLNIWLEQRFSYGFIEWYSNTYYEEDIAPLANLIDFCDDPLIVTKARMILDLLLHDLATQSHRGSFTSTSGRQYEEGKKSGDHSALRSITRKIWGYETAGKEAGLDQHFIYLTNYEVPEVIKEIGEDHDAGVIKASTGLNLKELVKEYPQGQSLGRVMMQWAMEAFSNPEVITHTLKYIHKNKMISNEFMNDFKFTNLSVLKYTGLLPLISRIIRPVTNGTPIQRANTYTYKTEDYSLATAQNYHPGEFGDQQHICSATISPQICIFTTHPASPLSEEGALSASPNYWVGNGRNPHSVQFKNVNLTIYVIEGSTGFMEKALLEETHCYFPAPSLDETEISDTIAFGRIGNTLIAVCGTGDLEQKGEELIQKGQKTCWITELSSLKHETFDAFKKRILLNSLRFEEADNTLCYSSENRRHALTFKGDYLIDGEKQDLEYERFESPYSTTKRKSPVIEIQHNGKGLLLDFDQAIREVRN
jgi:hypothetical protein